MASNLGIVQDSAAAIIALRRKSDDIADKRAREDHRRVVLQDQEDQALESRRASIFTVWTREHNSALEQHELDSATALNALKTRHAEELLELRKQQAAEIATLKRNNSNEYANINARSTASYNNRLGDIDQERDNIVASRSQSEDALKRKRAAEDEELEKEVLSAFAEMRLPPRPKKRSKPTARGSSSVTGGAALVGNLNVSKRPKLNHEAGEPSRSFATVPVSAVSSEKEGSFRLKAIQNTKDCILVAAWYSTALSSPKTYRWNAQQNSFEPYDGENKEEGKFADWVLNIEGGRIVYFNELTARIATRNEDGWLRVEFWNLEELTRFKRFCKLHSETIKFADKGFARERWD